MTSRVPKSSSWRCRNPNYVLDESQTVDSGHGVNSSKRNGCRHSWRQSIILTIFFLLSLLLCVSLNLPFLFPIALKKAYFWYHIYRVKEEDISHNSKNLLIRKERKITRICDMAENNYYAKAARIDKAKPINRDWGSTNDRDRNEEALPIIFVCPAIPRQPTCIYHCSTLEKFPVFNYAENACQWNGRRLPRPKINEAK